MEASLYARLGGNAGISRIVDYTIYAHLRNPLIRARFEHVKDLDHLRRMARDFFCAGAGGPEPYAGKDMRAAHRGMNISEQEYMAVIDDIMEALDAQGIDDATKRDVLAILYSLKGDVIRV